MVMAQRSKSMVVLASGRGSNFAALLAARRAGLLRAEIRALISDNEEAPALQIAVEAGLPGQFVDLSSRKREERDEALIHAVKAYHPDVVVMAGFMKIVGKKFIEAFRGKDGLSRIVNVHPSLLPSFPGRDSYRQAFEYGAKVAGVTVHLVELEVDSGPILAQESFKIDELESVEAVEKRGLSIEHRLLPETLNWFLEEDFEIKGRSIRVCTR